MDDALQINRPVFNINASDRQVVNKLHKNQDKFIWRASSTEKDNHADTHCFGANFYLTSFTLEECTVSPLPLEYTEQVNIPICNGVNVFTIDPGDVVILEFGQGLWFGYIMEKSLINQN